VAIKTNQVTLGTTRRKLTQSDSGNTRAYSRQAANGYSYSITLRPMIDIYVGGADVTASNGFLVLADEVISVDRYYGEALYGVAASGSGLVYVYESGV
jgi:hypothetical protein